MFGSFGEGESDGECEEEREGCGGGSLGGCEPSFLGCSCLTHCDESFVGNSIVGSFYLFNFLVQASFS